MGKTSKCTSIQMAGDSMPDVPRLVLESAVDDWISDYEVQGDFQAELSLTPATAYQSMITLVADWIRRGILIPGDMLDGFTPWLEPAAQAAERFVGRAMTLQVLTTPGQICWFDAGPNASSEFLRVDFPNN
jgi:hypothetical protein